MLHWKICSIKTLFLTLVSAFLLNTSAVAVENLKNILIPMPSACYSVYRVEGNSIYLKQYSKSCPSIETMTEVKVLDEAEEVEIYVEDKLWRKYEIKRKNLEENIKELEKKSKQIYIPESRVSDDIKSLAMQSYMLTQTPQYQQQVEEFKSQISSATGGNLPEQKFYRDAASEKTVLQDEERIYVFVSSSMPDETIRTYVRALHFIGRNTFIVLRGAVGGLYRLKPTAEWSVNMLKKDTLCEGQCDLYRTKIIIDPFLFRKYQITRVPAVVYVKNVINTEGLSEGLDSVKIKEAFVSYGDVSLSYHLKLIAEYSKDERIKLIADYLDK